MEKALITNNQYHESQSDIFVLISITSWIVLIITCWIPIFTLVSGKGNSIKNLWLFYKFKESILGEEEGEQFYYYFIFIILDLNFVIFNLIFIFTFTITTLGFIIYFYSLYKRKEKVIKEMLGKNSKFHFIPILFIISLFIIGESYNKEEDKYNDLFYLDYSDAGYIFSLVFTCLAIISLIFISLSTNITSPWYAVLTLNKGAYSCFFALLIYNFGFVFSNYVFYKIYKNNGDNILNFFKKSSLAFSIIIGILNNTASILLQDFMIALINLLIYLGMTISFYKRNKKIREDFLYEANGILDMIMIALSFFCIVFHIIRFKGLIPN